MHYKMAQAKCMSSVLDIGNLKNSLSDHTEFPPKYDKTNYANNRSRALNLKNLIEHYPKLSLGGEILQKSEMRKN